MAGSHFGATAVVSVLAGIVLVSVSAFGGLGSAAITSSSVTLSDSDPTPGSEVEVTVTATPNNQTVGFSFTHRFNQSVANASIDSTSLDSTIISTANQDGATVTASSGSVTAGEQITIEYTILTEEEDGKTVSITGSVANGVSQDLPERSYTIMAPETPPPPPVPTATPTPEPTPTPTPTPEPTPTATPEINAQIIDFDVVSGEFRQGETVDATATVENTGNVENTFFVSYSALGPDSGSYDNNDDTGQTVTLDPGDSQGVSLSWTVQSNSPTGTYDAITSVWEERDRDNLQTRLDSERRNNAFEVIETTATPTPEPTPTPTPEPTEVPTEEPTPTPTPTPEPAETDRAQPTTTQTPPQNVQEFAGQIFASLIGTELLVAIGTGVVVALLVVTWSKEVDN